MFKQNKNGVKRLAPICIINHEAPICFPAKRTKIGQQSLMTCEPIRAPCSLMLNERGRGRKYKLSTEKHIYPSIYSLQTHVIFWVMGGPEFMCTGWGTKPLQDTLTQATAANLSMFLDCGEKHNDGTGRICAHMEPWGRLKRRSQRYEVAGFTTVPPC